MKIELQALEHAYPGGDKALDGVDLTLDGNEPVAIIGQNGAGKTTLVKHFNGILRPTGGKVLIDGIDVNERSTAEWSRSVGYVFQNPDDQLFLESVRKEFEFGPRQIGMSDQDIAHRVDSIAELVGLTKKLDVHPFDLTPTEKKFCTIGAVIMMDPSVVIFDEPTCGQDASGNARLARIIERLKAQQEEMGHKQEQMRKEITLLTTRLSEKEAELKVLQRLFENARIAMGKDVRTLRQNLRENEPCPVCGGTDHPYRNEEQVVHSLYQNIEQEYQTASAEYQQLNNRNIALKQDLFHLSELSGEITVQLQAFLQEAEQKRPSSEEEQNPDYFEKQLHTVQGKLNLLAEKMHQYHQLYKEWQQHEGQIRTVRSACEALREGVARCHLLIQQVLAAKEQFELLKTAETTAREQFRVVSEQLITLRQERAPLLKGKSVEDAEAAIRKKEKQLNDSVEQVRKEGEEVQSRISGMQGEIRQLNSSIDELMLRKEQIADPEHLPETIARQQATNQETERRLSTVEARLLQQEQNRKKLKQLEQELTEKQETANRWGKLNKLIGSADGTKFKVIAQSYTLNLLLMHANKHLSYLSKRYRLQQVPGTLALQVIDCDMCDEVRTVYSLSGGESFLISLALALGLSSLSSNNLKVESLFIDEGFGSLDADSLRTVMEALEQLQMQGRKIGVISHVQEMSERIAVQVQLHRAANGKSAITLTN